MSNVLLHKFQSDRPTGANALLVRKPNWNDEHVFSGGGMGDLLMRDTGQTDGASWITAVATGSLLRSAGATTKPTWSTATFPDTATTGDVLYASASNTWASLSAGASGTFLRATGAASAPGWSTTVWPNSAVTGDLLYASATNTIGALTAVAAGSFLRSNGVAAAPVWSTSTWPNTATIGDLVYASATNGYANLADVAVGSYLRSGGVATAPLWSTTTLPNAATQGDLLHASAANVYGNLAAVATGSVLVSAGTGTAPAWSASPVLTTVSIKTTNAAQEDVQAASELLTLSTVGATTDTSANLLPANSIIMAVVARLTTAIVGGTSWKMGDSFVDDRFTSANSTLALGTTDVGLNHIGQADFSGQRQISAAPVRVTCAAVPSAGAVRITVYYRKYTAPAS